MAADGDACRCGHARREHSPARGDDYRCGAENCYCSGFDDPFGDAPEARKRAGGLMARVKKLRPKPGDVIVLNLERPAPADEIERTRLRLRRNFPRNRVVIIENGEVTIE